MSVDYQSFLASKRARVAPVGRDVDPSDLPGVLRDFQRDIVAWSVSKGRAALWTTTGTGKTVMQLAWLQQSAPRRGLVLAPLAVCHQTIREARDKLSLDLRYAPDEDTASHPGLWITNYERADRMPVDGLEAVVLDEGSILRDSTGKTRNLLIERFASVPRRLTCTATPAPNQPEELTNQSEWVGAMSRVDMLASYFIHDESGWRPKGHAYGPMYRWLAQWAIALRRPSDLGYDDTGYVLPGLEIIPEVVDADVSAEGQLFATDLGGVGGRARARRETLAARVRRTAEIVDAERDEQWAIWCGLNDEAAALAREIPGSVNVHGSMSPEEKAEALLAFADGEIKHIITKSSIAARGLNWQHCARHAFCGLGDSFEDYFQALRRSYRSGQTRVVRGHVVVSELEQQVAANVARKEREYEHAMTQLVQAMQRARDMEVAA